MEIYAHLSDDPFKQAANRCVWRRRGDERTKGSGSADVIALHVMAWRVEPTKLASPAQHSGRGQAWHFSPWPAQGMAGTMQATS